MSEQHLTSWRSLGSASRTGSFLQAEAAEDPQTTDLVQPGMGVEASHLPSTPQVLVVQSFPSSHDASDEHEMTGTGVLDQFSSLSKLQPVPTKDIQRIKRKR